jgi:hypothetical protein
MARKLSIQFFRNAGSIGGQRSAEARKGITDYKAMGRKGGMKSREKFLAGLSETTGQKEIPK